MNMTRKKFIKRVMAIGIPRNNARQWAEYAKKGISYNEIWNIFMYELKGCYIRSVIENGFGMAMNNNRDDKTD